MGRWSVTVISKVSEDVCGDALMADAEQISRRWL